MKTSTVSRSVASLLPGVLAFVLWASSATVNAGQSPPDLFLQGIVFRPDVTVDIHARVFVNPAHPSQGVTVLALHGLSHTANSWGPFADSLFTHNPAGRKVGQVVALNMPGHGQSGVPAGLPLGDLTLDDYATILVRCLEALRDYKFHPRTVIAHSLGGLVTQMAQQQLLEQGTSLRRAFNIDAVMFLGTATPSAVADDNSFWLPIIGMCEAYGWTVVPFPAFAIDWRGGVLFWNFNGELIPGTPSLEEIVENGYIGAEPLAVLKQMTGYPPFERPSVDPGIFGVRSRTTLKLITYEQDLLDSTLTAQQVYEYLTGDLGLTQFFIVPGDNTAHSLHIADPGYLLESIAGQITFP
jgi:pimeloyl-ACP methyl ester carboxylesterase